jgi:hypothetical protein
MWLTVPRVQFSGEQSKDEHKQESAGNPKYVDKTHYGTIRNFPSIDRSIMQCTKCHSYKFWTNWNWIQHVLHNNLISELWQVVKRHWSGIRDLKNILILTLWHKYQMALQAFLPHTLETGYNIKSSWQTKLHGLSPRANYTDRVAAAGRRS